MSGEGYVRERQEMGSRIVCLERRNQGERFRKSEDGSACLQWLK